ncbi:MAG TPA: EAL domain-containing protein [Caldithrix abyssi]|uniref:EAL domain-containing protein n=1 Tax=Caldithrix abyssi TaxID=187145 RepID=A0A7V4U2H0_CALAY|nr:EAL domain-containing protein [Caldithrix abyssi]
MKRWLIRLAIRILKQYSENAEPFDSDYLLRKLPMEVAVYDRDGKYIFVNEYYCPDEMLRRQLPGRDDYFYFSQIGAETGPLKKREENRQKALAEKRIVHFTEGIYLARTDKTRYYKRFAQPFADGAYVALFGSDLTAVVHAQKELKYLAYHDKLTGLFNRDAFNEQLDQVLMELERLPEKTTVALLFCDLDNFKLVNDSLGHDYGDRVLQEVSRRLRETLRKSDRIYRLGGDEFVVILKNLKNDYEAGLVAQKLIAAISQPYIINQTTINYLSASVGIVLMPQNGTNRELLIKKADTAMYLAKKQGKDGYRFYSDQISQTASRTMQLEKNLRELVVKGVFNEQMHIVYQPIFEKENDNHFRIAGGEALIRWKSPDSGMVPPSQFIPIAEKSNLIIPIGQWVLERSLYEYRNFYQITGNREFYLSVNLSTKQLHSNKLIGLIRELIETLDINPRMLQFELTETSYLEQDERVIRNLHALIDLGVRIAIDDFGSGYASMSYLQRVPATAIKIDRAFVNNLENNRQHREMIRSIIQLSKNLKLDIIAEGVEDVHQLQILDKYKCTKYQGFLFGRPVSYADFSKALSKNSSMEINLSVAAASALS